jgi:hypothetical protein
MRCRVCLKADEYVWRHRFFRKSYKAPARASIWLSFGSSSGSYRYSVSRMQSKAQLPLLVSTLNAVWPERLRDPATTV